uniref:Uncharacterized protein LOC114346108 n=1 Tax=Diabrotica virgifera virgifera TaxID=50390 RepID=A0A6P7H4U7_DIAVI
MNSTKNSRGRQRNDSLNILILISLKRALDHDRYVIEDPQGSVRSQKKNEAVSSNDKMKPFNTDVSSESKGDMDPNETDLQDNERSTIIVIKASCAKKITYVLF